MLGLIVTGCAAFQMTTDPHSLHSSLGLGCMLYLRLPWLLTTSGSLAAVLKAVAACHASAVLELGPWPEHELHPV